MRKIKYLKRKNLIFHRGSFTVEASIIFSLVFLITVLLVYVFIIMYQYIVLQGVTSETSNRGAYFYVNQSDLRNNNLIKSDLYWRIFDSKAQSKTDSIKSYASESLEPAIITTTKEVNVNTSFSYLIKHIKVTIIEHYPIPIGGMLTVFGISPSLQLQAQTSSPLEDNAEFVRNLDMIMDIKNCLVNSDNKWIGSGSKVNEVLDKLINRL